MAGKVFLLCCLLVTAGYGCPATIEETPAIEEVEPRQKHRLTRPRRCQHLLRETPGRWDPDTDTYPRNFEWEECMGVA